MKKALFIIATLFCVCNINAQSAAEKQVAKIFYGDQSHQIITQQDGYHIWDGYKGKMLYKEFEGDATITITFNGGKTEFTKTKMKPGSILCVPIYLEQGQKILIIIAKKGKNEEIEIYRE